MDRLTITNTEQSFEVTPRDSLRLEIRLNVSPNGRVWSHIGDRLYEFGTNSTCSETLVVTNSQYEFLYSKYQSLNRTPA